MGHMCAHGHTGMSRVEPSPTDHAKRNMRDPSRSWALSHAQARAPHRPPAACKRNGPQTPEHAPTRPIPVPIPNLHPHTSMVHDARSLWDIRRIRIQ
eukprot:3464449-Prymnesium_polylepis.1